MRQDLFVGLPVACDVGWYFVLNDLYLGHILTLERVEEAHEI